MTKFAFGMLWLSTSALSMSAAYADSQTASDEQSNHARAAYYARDFGRAIGETKSALDRYKAYAVGVAFARMPMEGGGLGLNAEWAHGFAKGLCHRRPNETEAEYEVQAIIQFRNYLSGSVQDGGIGLSSADAQKDALKVAAELPPSSDGRRLNENATEARYGQLLARYPRWTQTSEQGIESSAVDRFAVMSLIAQPRSSKSDYSVWINQYKPIFEFARRPLGTAGLGLTLEEAGHFALELIQRRDRNAFQEIEAYQVFYDYFTTIAANVGDQMEPAQAKQHALKLSRALVHASKTSAQIYLDLTQAVKLFMSTPIRKGGLGYDNDQVNQHFDELRTLAETPLSLFLLQSYYNQALASDLNRMVDLGQYDEATARDWAWQQVKTLPKDLTMSDRLDALGFTKTYRTSPNPLAHDYPRISRPRRILIRVKSCARSLISTVKSKYSTWADQMRNL